MQDQMAAYFSPGLRRLMQNQDQSMLEPAMVDCTVMFADRRGHSRMLELAKSDDEILDRLDENQRVVGLITEEIFRSSGVVTDFAGDGALGLWGWPNIGVADHNHALEAVEAAEAILHRLADRVVYEEELGRHMSAVRIGISTGRIAVGRTGPSQQWHISVFGSVANLGARLERIAKEFHIPMLISDDTWKRIRGERDRRFRKLCVIRPAGFEESYPIHELVLPTEVGGSGISEENAAIYESALEHFISRNWDATIDTLETLPENDPPTNWLKNNALSFRRSPPPHGWSGEVQSLSK
jgi:adenylate cyclase